METQKRDLSPRDAIHERLMRSVLKGIDDTPLVLKGGTALLLAYGLDRFSEDLDFDAPHKLNLESRIRRSVPFGITVDGIDPLKDTATVTRYRVRYQSEHGKRSLKLEVSYRTPPQQSEVRSVHGFRVASLPRVIDQKLKAAHDGDDPRSKVRDLYDLDFVARRWPAVFTDELASRLRSFAADPDVLVSRYQADYDEDDLIPDLVELDQLALRLHCSAEEIAACRSEVAKRVGRLANLKNTAGAAYTFWKHAVEAINAANAGDNSAYEADWCRAEDATIRESMVEHGQSSESVADALCKHSPGAVTATRQAAIRAEIEQLNPERKAMSAIDARLYFTFRKGCDVGSGVVVDTATGEFDGEQAYHDMASLTEDDPAGPEGHYLQIGEHRFEVVHETGNNWKFRVIDLDGLRRVAAEMEPESEPERKSDYSSPSPF